MFLDNMNVDVAHGTRGIEQTCAVRGLVRDRAVQERFNIGNLFMSLRANATLYTLIKELANFMSKSGRNKESDNMNMMEYSERAQSVQQLAQLFTKYPCLFARLGRTEKHNRVRQREGQGGQSTQTLSAMDLRVKRKAKLSARSNKSDTVNA